MAIDDIPVASLEIPVSLHIEGTEYQHNQRICKRKPIEFIVFLQFYPACGKTLTTGTPEHGYIAMLGARMFRS